jgi:hypothetical protein
MSTMSPPTTTYGPMPEFRFRGRCTIDGCGWVGQWFRNVRPGEEVDALKGVVGGGLTPGEDFAWGDVLSHSLSEHKVGGDGVVCRGASCDSEALS